MPDSLGEGRLEEPKSMLTQSGMDRERRELRSTIKFYRTLGTLAVAGWVAGFIHVLIVLLSEGDNTGVMLSGTGLAFLGSLLFFIAFKTRMGSRSMYPNAWAEHERNLEAYRSAQGSR